MKIAKKICGSVSMIPGDRFFRAHEMAEHFQIMAA
jgi:hypothetical protein